MEIKPLSQDLIPALYKFNSGIYPDKKIPAKEYLNFWLSKSADECKESLVLVDNDGSIHGQILTSAMSIYYKGEKLDTVWLFDLIVDEALRKEAWGMDIIVECFMKHPRSCSTGSGPTALPIHLKLGNKLLGEIRKYVGITNPLWLAMSAFRGIIPISKYPQAVRGGSRNYLLLGEDEFPRLTKPFNETMWEPARDEAYLKWRFASSLHQYAFYKDTHNDNYFVLRTIRQYGITAMLLVDYRFNSDDCEAFEQILSAVKTIMDELHLAVMITGSTIASVDNILEKQHFKSVGRPRPVIGFQNVKGKDADIKSRRFAFVTLADSDGETNWI